MSQEQEYFAFGGPAKCRVCGRPLSNLDSVRTGIGPVCAATRCVQAAYARSPAVTTWDQIVTMKQLPGPVPREFIFERTADGPTFNFPQVILYHSTRAMELGSGLADAALNVLIHFCNGRKAWRLHQEFKSTMIARHDGSWQQGCGVPGAGRHVIRAHEVASWIASHNVSVDML